MGHRRSVTVAGGTFTFDGLGHAATVSVTGVEGAAVAGREPDVTAPAPVPRLRVGVAPSRPDSFGDPEYVE
jgi:hypothetical protein